MKEVRSSCTNIDLCFIPKKKINNKNIIKRGLIATIFFKLHGGRNKS